VPSNARTTEDDPVTSRYTVRSTARPALGHLGLTREAVLPALQRLLQGYDERGRGGLADTDVAVDSVGVEVDSVAGLDVVRDLAVLDVEVSGEEVEELAAGVLVGAGFAVALVREKFGEVGVEETVGNEVAEGLEEVGGVRHAGLGQAYALLAAMHAEEGVGFGIEEVAEVFGEDHGDACEVAEGGDDASGLELREEAGGEPGVAAEVDEAHGFFEPEVLDALADAFFRDEGFRGLTDDLEVAEIGRVRAWVEAGAGFGGEIRGGLAIHSLFLIDSGSEAMGLRLSGLRMLG